MHKTNTQVCLRTKMSSNHVVISRDQTAVALLCLVVSMEKREILWGGLTISAQLGWPLPASQWASPGNVQPTLQSLSQSEHLWLTVSPLQALLLQPELRLGPTAQGKPQCCPHAENPDTQHVNKQGPRQQQNTVN